MCGIRSRVARARCAHAESSPRAAPLALVHRSSARYISAAKLLGGRIRELRKARGWTLYDEASDAMDIDLKQPPATRNRVAQRHAGDAGQGGGGLGVELDELFSFAPCRGLADRRGDSPRNAIVLADLATTACCRTMR